MNIQSSQRCAGAFLCKSAPPPECPAPVYFGPWQVSNPAQGIHSAVRVKAQASRAPDIHTSVQPPSSAQRAIQLLQTWKSKHDEEKKEIAKVASELKQPGMTVQSSAALKILIKKLVTSKLSYNDNILVIHALLELGCVVPTGTVVNSTDSPLVNVKLLEKLCSCSENPQIFVRENALSLLTLGSKRSYQLLITHLDSKDIIKIVQASDFYNIYKLFRGQNEIKPLPDICPEVVKVIWEALLPDTTLALNKLKEALSQGVTAPFREKTTHSLEYKLIYTLIWLNYHNHPETITALIGKLSENHCKSLSLLSLSLGLENFSKCLARIEAARFSSINSHLLHQLVLMSSKIDFLYLHIELYTSLEPLFSALGISSDQLKTMASQQDDSGRLPLQVLFEEHINCATSDPLFSMDKQRFQSWLDFLLQHSPKDALPNCLEKLLSSNELKNINYYKALLKFIKAGCNLKKVCTFVKEGKDGNITLFDMPENDRNDNSQNILALLKHFQQHPDTLSLPEKTEEMMRTLQLSPAYQAVTLMAMEPQQRRELLMIWRNDPVRMESLFLDRKFSIKQRYKGPWLPFMAIMQHDLPGPRDESTAIALEKHITGRQELMEETTLPQLPAHLLERWKEAEQVDMYGRSLRVGIKRPQTSDKSNGSAQEFRLKFRKKGLESESWSDFIREQAVASFLDAPQTSLRLESELLKPGGVYRLHNIRDILSRKCYLPEAFRNSLEKCIHIDSDGSSCVQVLEDSSATEHYHHYPYLIDPASGLTRDSAFEGIRLYCRDSGKLWREGIKSPDAMGAFHNQAGSKPWNPFPGYSLRRQGLFCTSKLSAWNNQIPDIAHAPVGMRDYQGVMAMDKLPDDIYGERRLNWSDPLDMRRGRLIELGKQFYGSTFNWLRVRHDLNELNHLIPDHAQTLSNELVTLSADLFSSAFGGDVDAWKASFSEVLPAETLKQLIRECLYWCSPQHPYVEDIHNNRFPTEVYPDHNHSDLELSSDELYEDGFKDHASAKGTNLGHRDGGNIVVHHLAAIFWFGVMEGVLQ